MHTQGSETSQYLEEKKTTSISLVAASEHEGAQTVDLPTLLVAIRVVRVNLGVVRQLGV